MKGNKKIILDSLLIVLVNVSLGVFLSQINLLKQLQFYASNFPEYYLHIVIPLTFSLLISLLYFALRRWNESVKLNHLAERTITTDPLTRLYNRRALEMKLQDEWERFIRYQQPFCLLMIDLDGFKSINDAFGHREGDRILVETSEKLLSNIRKTDFCSRWGGTEFLVLCPVTELKSIEVVAERLRNDIYSLLKGGVELSASIAIGEADPTKSLDILIKDVDYGLYKAKKIGGNSVVAC